MKPLWTLLTVALLLFGAGMLVGEAIVNAQDSVLPPTQPPTEPVGKLDIRSTAGPIVLKASTVWLATERTAIDLELVITANVVQRIVLWSDGSITESTRAIPAPLKDCPADINGDGSVGVADLMILNAMWGTDCPK